MNRNIKPPAIDKEDKLIARLADLLENEGVELTPYLIVREKIRLGITPSGKELTEMATHFTDCVNQYRRENP